MENNHGSSVRRLVEAARTGDAGAVARLLERYRSYLRFLARDQIFATLQGKIGASDAAWEILLVIQVRDTVAGNPVAEPRLDRPGESQVRMPQPTTASNRATWRDSSSGCAPATATG